MELLDRVFSLTGTERILDIGGQVGRGSDQILDRHPAKDRLAAVNVDVKHLADVRAAYPEALACKADARRLPFRDESFDLVFSNAVIEHVGSLEDQAAMAREVARVGRAWFLTTPNRWYPFEFHTRLPLIGWLPEPWMTRISRLWSYNHVRRRYQRGVGGGTRLMTRRELRRLFPSSHVIASRVTFYPETLIVVGPKERVPLERIRG